MSIFTKAFSQAIKANDAFEKLGSKLTIASIPTGFDLIDLANASVDPISGDLEAGFREGHIVSIIGPTGSGKTTLALTLCSEIVKPFKNGSLHIFDTEKAYNMSRFKQLYAKKNPEYYKDFDEKNEDRKVFHWNEYTYLDALRVYIAELNEVKQANREALMEKFTDINGKEVEVMAPSVVVIDSLAALYSEKRAKAIEDAKEAQEGSTNMAGSQTAIENNDFFGKCLNMLFSSNIILVVVNHISTKVQTGPTPEKNPFPFLKPDENVRGGTGFWFYSDFFIRIDRGTLVTADKAPWKKRAFINKVQVLKSRGHEGGVKYPMVFNFTDGGIYDNNLSKIEFLKENGKVKTGVSNYLVDNPDIKFKMVDYLSKMENDPEFAAAIDDAVVKVFYNNLPSKDLDSNEPQEEADLKA